MSVSSPRQVRIVLMTGPNAEHRYMANRLAEALPLAAIIVDHGKPASTAKRLKQIWKRYTPWQLAGRACVMTLRAVMRDHQRRADRLRSVFGIASDEFQHPDLLRHVHGINTPEAVSVVEAQEPDLLLVFGTNIVRNKVLSLARQVALNVHTGISPHYRGAECTFWPLHSDDPGMLGATVHECTHEVDGGKVFATGRPRLQADDDAFSVFARCVITAADLYIQVVKQLVAGEATGLAQDLSIGREFKAADHGLRAELRVRRLIRQGLIRRYVAAGTHPHPGV